MALVDGTDSGIGYGRAPAPAPGPVWDANIGAYRDPVSGRVAVGSDAAGWRWVTEAEYRPMPAPAYPSATKHTSPAPAPTPAPASLQVIGGQIVRLPR